MFGIRIAMILMKRGFFKVARQVIKFLGFKKIYPVDELKIDRGLTNLWI